MKEKKEYIAPEVDVLVLEDLDIFTLSDGGSGSGGSGTLG